MNSLIELHGITRSYRLGGGELKVLKGISLCIEEGEFVAIMGHSGSGKSTQIPQMLLDAGILGNGRAVILQPRRLAARPRTAGRYRPGL